MASASGRGIKAVFNSNSFAAYRRAALEQIGGFPEHVIFGEDQLAAAHMLISGWVVCYEASATVDHSHSHTIIGEFRRYFDHGVTHAQNTWLFDHFGTASAAGLRFVLSEMAYLFREEPTSIPEACLRTLLKYIGYRLGGNQSKLPCWVKERLSLQSGYFTTVRKH
jgi:rhamnosyltransferase